MSDRSLRITFDLPEAQAEALEQFVRRAGFADFREHAADTAETYRMLYAADQLRKALERAVTVE